MMRPAYRWMCAVALSLSPCAVLPAAAQGPSAAIGSGEAFVLAVPPREETAIDAELTAADNDFLDAREAENQATAARTQAQSSIESKKAEIADNKRSRDAAKKSGSETEATTLDVQRRALERERDLLEQRATLRAAEIDLARQKGELALFVKKTLEFERSLTAKRRELSTVTSGTPAAATLQRVVLDLEQQTLSARVREADKKIDVASREKRVAASLLKLVEAQRRMVISE
jgi:hypothetical protein